VTTFRLRVRYDGTGFLGWQVQPDGRTVQGEIERALGTILADPVRIAGAGRTDRGVHALGQVASFTTDRAIPPDALRRALAGLLPRDVAVSRVEVAPDAFHARHSAVGRRYRYHLTDRDTPIRRRYAWVRRRLPDPDRLNAASAPLLGRHRFDAFTLAEARRIDTTCTVRRIAWSAGPRGLRLEIAADRFVQRMVRLIVGALIRLERDGSLDPARIAAALAAGGFDRPPAAAPPQGLFFAAAEYPPDGEVVPVVNDGPDVE